MLNNKVFIKRFGEEIQFNTTAGVLPLIAIIDVENASENVGETKINNQTLILSVKENDVENQGIARRQEVIVRGKTYSIVEIGNDMNGLAQFRVSRS